MENVDLIVMRAVEAKKGNKCNHPIFRDNRDLIVTHCYVF